MIIGTSFEGDDNDTLKMVQHDAYWELVPWLYQNAANYYLLDVKYPKVFPDFVTIIRKIKSFDHRVLQDAHDLIAAYYRFMLCPHQNPSNLPDDFDIKAYYLAAWKSFYFLEAASLGKIEEIAEAIATAVAYQNKDRGYAAEDRLRELLLHRYSSMSRLGLSNP